MAKAKKTVKKAAGKAAKKPVRKATKKVVKPAVKKTVKKAVKKAAKPAVKKAKKVAKKAAKAPARTVRKAKPKAAAKPPVKMMKRAPRKIRASGPSPQQTAYAKGVASFNARRFPAAAKAFTKAVAGPDPALRHRASVHLRICERQIASEPKLRTAEDRYNYAVRLINDRRLEDARKYLTLALKQDRKGAHLHYASGVVSALEGDVEGARASLVEAIRLDPQNRILAQNDVDLSGIASEASIQALLNDHPGGASQ